MLISEVSRNNGLSVDTLRYYERIGLLPPVSRGKGGIRDYRAADCRWVEFIKCMRCAGIPVETLVEYVALFQQGEKKTRVVRKGILIEQRKLLAERLAELQKTLKKLDWKIKNYDTTLIAAEKKLAGEKGKRRRPAARQE
jgi:DNA-binding transcriptional MerR regulator